MRQSHAHMYNYNIHGMDGRGWGGELGMGCQWLAGLVSSERGKIMIGSSDNNSGGACSGWGSCVMYIVALGSNLALCFGFFFHLLKFF